MSEVALRYPLQLDDAGYAVTTTDQPQLWQDRVAVLLSTLVGERPGDLIYGSEVAIATFMPGDTTTQIVTQTVQNAFFRYLPTLKLAQTQVDPAVSTDTNLVVNILFTIPDGTEVSVSTTLDAASLGIGQV